MPTPPKKRHGNIKVHKPKIKNNRKYKFVSDGTCVNCRDIDEIKEGFTSNITPDKTPKITPTIEDPNGQSWTRGWWGGDYPGCCCHYVDGEKTCTDQIYEDDCLNSGDYTDPAWWLGGCNYNNGCAHFCGTYDDCAFDRYPAVKRIWMDPEVCEKNPELLCWNSPVLDRQPYALMDFGFQILLDGWDPWVGKPGTPIPPPTVPSQNVPKPYKGWRGHWYNVFDIWNPNNWCMGTDMYPSCGDTVCSSADYPASNCCDNAYDPGQDAIPYFTVDWFQEYNIVIKPRRYDVNGEPCVIIPPEPECYLNEDCPEGFCCEDEVCIEGDDDDCNDTTGSPISTYVGADEYCNEPIEVDFRLPWCSGSPGICSDHDVGCYDVHGWMGAYDVFIDKHFLPERGNPDNKQPHFGYEAEPHPGYPGGAPCTPQRTIKLRWEAGDNSPRYIKFRYNYESNSLRNMGMSPGQIKDQFLNRVISPNSSVAKENRIANLTRGATEENKWFFPFGRTRSYGATYGGLEFAIAVPNDASWNHHRVAWSQYQGQHHEFNPDRSGESDRGLYYWGSTIGNMVGMPFPPHARSRHLYPFLKSMVNYPDYPEEYESWPIEIDNSVTRPWGDNVKEQSERYFDSFNWTIPGNKLPENI